MAGGLRELCTGGSGKTARVREGRGRPGGREQGREGRGGGCRHVLRSPAKTHSHTKRGEHAHAWQATMRVGSFSAPWGRCMISPNILMIITALLLYAHGFVHPTPASKGFREEITHGLRVPPVLVATTSWLPRSHGGDLAAPAGPCFTLPTRWGDTLGGGLFSQAPPTLLGEPATFLLIRQPLRPR